jgi:hypothetical protein
MSNLAPFEVVIELLLCDATLLMCHIPNHRWTLTDDMFDGEIAHNRGNGFRGVDINLINICALEYPLTVLIHLLAIKDKLAEGWSYGHNHIHAHVH